MATLRRVLLLLAVLAAIAIGAYAGYTYRENKNAVSSRSDGGAVTVVVAPPTAAATTVS